MSELDDALFRASRYNNSAYHPESNPYGHSGKGGTLANWVRSLKDGVTIYNGMATLWNSINFVAERSAVVTLVQEARELVRQITRGTAEGLSFAAINKVLSASPALVDCLVWDIWREVDKDGVCWADKCDHQTWATMQPAAGSRGLKRRPPRQALVLLFTDRLEIYDAWETDPVSGAPLLWWAARAGGAWGGSLDASTFHALGSAGNLLRRVEARQGRLYLAGADAFVTLDFVADRATYRGALTSTCGVYRGGLAEADAGRGHSLGGVAPLAGAPNAVHARVVPGGVTDAAGLPVPTVVVGTDAGWSAIHPDGAVYSLSTYTVTQIFLDEMNRVWISSPAGIYGFGPLIYAPATFGAWITARFDSSGVVRHVANEARLDIAGGAGVIAGTGAQDATGFSMLAVNYVDPAASMVAHIRTTYATPWLVGDVRLCLSGDSLTDRSGRGTAVAGTATFAQVAGGDLCATTVTSTITATVTHGGAVYGWACFAGRWKFCRSTGDWAGYVTETDGVLTINTGLVFSRLVYTMTMPTPAQLVRIEADDRPLFGTGVGMLLGGASDVVVALRRNAATGGWQVGTASGETLFSAFVRTSFSAAGSIKVLAAAGGTRLVATNADVRVVMDAVAGKEAVLGGGNAVSINGSVEAVGVTTDATPLDLAPRVAVGERELVMVEARVIGKVYGSQDTEYITYVRRGTFTRWQGSNVSQYGATQSIGSDTETTGAADAVFVADATSNTVSIRVTGVAGKRVAWKAGVQIHRISEDQSYA